MSRAADWAPAPWTLVDLGEGSGFEILDAAGKTVCRTGCHIQQYAPDMERRNAELLAAARALLAAAESAIQTIRTWHGMPFGTDERGRASEREAWRIYFNYAPEMQAIRAAIASAKGEL